MSPTLDAIESVLAALEAAQKRVGKLKTKQVTQIEVVDYLKSVSYVWFRTHRQKVDAILPSTSVSEIDSHFQRLLHATTKASAKGTYVSALKDAKGAIAAARSIVLTAPKPLSTASDIQPDFSPLASDSQMQDILRRRWTECQRCIDAGAHLAATVMMGGFLEALFVARANKMVDKGSLFRAKATPIDPKTKKPLQLPQWTLSPYIDVGHELGWISSSGKDVAAVLRDYRNYVHPEKERSHGVELNVHDSQMFWQVTKSLATQLLSIQTTNP